jgi:hypothetical protein
MKKILLVLFLIPALSLAEKKLAHEVTDAMILKQVHGYNDMPKEKQLKIKLDYAKKMRRGMHVKHLLALDDLFSAGGIIGSQMKKLDKDYCAAIHSLDKQILQLEKKLGAEAGSSSSGFMRFGHKVKCGCKTAWYKVKSGCGRLKNKISGSKKPLSESNSTQKSNKQPSPKASAAKK